MRWNTIAKTIEIEEGGTKSFIVEERPIIVSKINGELYAVDAVCPHKFGYLPLGRKNGERIVCPAHSAEFDLKTGKMTKGRVSTHTIPPSIVSVDDLNAYEVMVDGEDIKIRI